MEFTVQKWEDVYRDTYALYERIKDSQFIPNIVVGIARGGWIPTRLISDFFNLKQTANIKVEAYQMIGQEDIKPKITQDIQANLQDKKVLIVDDVADSGATLQTVVDEVESHGPSEIRTAVLYYKPRSTIKPDYYTYETTDWVIFSWSYIEAIDDLRAKWRNEGWSDLKIQNKCKSIGIPSDIVDNYFAN